jgi:hypothetical protein
MSRIIKMHGELRLNNVLPAECFGKAGPSSGRTYEIGNRDYLMLILKLLP